MDEKRFNVRVYALITSGRNELLVAEEYHYNTFMRKFPGGGLQFGEGSLHALERELREEIGMSVDGLRHFHTTDFFVKSAFNPNHQVLGIYFYGSANPDMEKMFRGTYTMPDSNGVEVFRWRNVNDIRPSDFTFPVDRQAFEVFQKENPQGVSFI